MKRLILIWSLMMASIAVFSQSTVDEFIYIDTPIDARLLLKNLKHNARNYVAHMGWRGKIADEFYKALEEYESAIEQGRLSMNQSGALIDKSGLLNDGVPLIFYKTYTYLTEEEYKKLSKKKKKQCVTFYPNREVARYIGGMAGAIYNKSEKEKSPEFIKDKEILNSFKQFGVRK